MANLWCIETNSGMLSAHTPDYLDVEQPYPVLAEGVDGNVYLINPDWPADAAGNLLPSALLTLADDGISLRAKTIDERMGAVRTGDAFLP